MQSVAERCCRVCGIRTARCCLRKDVVTISVQSGPIEGSTDSEHQLDIIIEPHRYNTIKETKGLAVLPKTQKSFTQANKSIFVSFIE